MSEHTESKGEFSSRPVDFDRPKLPEFKKLEDPQKLAAFMALQTTQNSDFNLKLKTGAVAYQEASIHLAATTQLVEMPLANEKKTQRVAILRAADIVRATNGDRGKFHDMVDSYFAHQLRQAQETAYVVITNNATDLADPQINIEQQLAEIVAAFPKNYSELDAVTQIKIAANIIKKNNFQITPDEMRVTLLRVELMRQEFDQTMTVLKSDAAADAFIAAVQSGKDPDQAFQAALTNSSKKTRAQYAQHIKKTQAKNVADLQPPRVKGTRVDVLTKNKASAVVRSIERSGAIMNMGVGNRGEMLFGGLARTVSLYAVGGEPKLFIYDANSDTGVRGPIDTNPEAVQSALKEVVVDLHFSQEFRRYVTFESEKDPNLIIDEKLFKITHALAPSVGRNAGTALSSLERLVVSNIAHMCVNGDSEYPTLQERVKFFEQLIAYPGRKDLAREFLTTIDLRDPTEDYSVSNFEADLRKRYTMK